ncbi:MAG: peptidoglycan-binding domain-containing protein [bacterium]
MMKYKVSIVGFLSISMFFSAILFSTHVAYASSSTSGYAWSENSGYVDFSQVTVDDSALSGYAYSPDIGWISLNCSNTNTCGTIDYKVVNTSGVLSGYAWSENTGYVDFSQVSVNTTTGVFSGYAYSPNIGWISMNCSNTTSCNTIDYKVTTTWKKAEAVVNHGHPAPTITSSNSGGPSSSGPTTLPPSSPTTLTPPVNSSPQVSPITNLNNSHCTITTNILKLWYVGDKVKCVQTILGLFPDGIFGPLTKQFIVKFQKDHSLTADGIVGPVTRAILK